MSKTNIVRFVGIFLSLISDARAHHPLANELMKNGNIQKAVNLTNFQQKGNFSDMFASTKAEVVVTDVGNKIIRVGGELPNNGTLVIQGESYLDLFDSKDIQNPISLLQKIINTKTRPVSVSLPVSEPYFIFSAPQVLDKSKGSNSVPNMKSGALKEAMKLQRVKRHHPSILSSMLSRLQSYALVPIKTPTGATRYMLLKDPKFIVYNQKNQQRSNNQPVVKVQPVQPAATMPARPPTPLQAAAKAPAPQNSPWLVSPLKGKHKMVSIGRMPPEAGGGGLTAANLGNPFQSITAAPNIQKLPPQPIAKKNTIDKPVVTPIPATTTTQATTTKPTTNMIDTMVSKMAVIAAGIPKPQEMINFDNARQDAINKLDAVIINKAERRDVVSFAKSLLHAMKILNEVVVKHGERRDIAVFAQKMLSGLKTLDGMVKTKSKQEVVNFAKSLVDTIKHFNIESAAQPPTTAAPPTTTTVATTAQMTEASTFIDGNMDPPTTTEEYEMEDLMTSTPYYSYMGATPSLPVERPAKKTPKKSPPPGVVGWQGPTTEPALGPLDRINTTDVPEEIEAKPDKTPAEKRRDFLERNPHLRGKLGKLKKTTPSPAGVATTASPNAPVQLQSSNSQTPIVNTKGTAPTQKNNKNKNSVLESFVLKKKNKKPKGKLKISGSRSTSTDPDINRQHLPLYRRLKAAYYGHARRNPLLYLLGR